MKKAIVTLVLTFTACLMQAQAPKNTSDVSDKDKKFAEKAYQASLIEIKLGELAMSRGLSQEVRTLGQHMVTDHTKANNDLKAMAAKKNIPISFDMNEGGKKTWEDMSAKKGKDFDEAYTKAMVKDHKNAIDLFKDEAKNGSDLDLIKWAASTTSTLEHHKEMAENASKVAKK